MAHVDGIMAVGPKKDLVDLQKQLAAKYEVKHQILGPYKGEAQSVEFLGRTASWTNEGLRYEAGVKHAQELLREWHLEDGKEVPTPGVTNEKEAEDDEELLGEEAATKFRRGAARCNYLSQDRCDLAYATKEVVRRMACPSRGDERRLKRLIRYLRHHPRGSYTFRWQSAEEVASIRCFVDSDWAGCGRTRKSTSGGALMRGHHCLGQWSRTQSCVALSSGEAELNAALKGGTELLGLRTMLRELGLDAQLQICGDSSACFGTVHREGCGRIKHLSLIHI